MRTFIGYEHFQPAPTAHLVLLDARLPELHTLCQALVAHALPVVVQPDQTALQALQSVVSLHEQPDGAAPLRWAGLHLVGHGEPGRLLLGRTWVDATAIDQDLLDWRTFSHTLAVDALCWVYGCHSGLGEPGHAFINALADALRTHVHAASHAFGACEHGGSWTFDRGTVPGVAAHNPVAAVWEQTGWGHVLMAANTAPTFSGEPGKAIIPIGSGVDQARSVIQQSDGKLVLAGYSSNGSNTDFSLIRLNADGSLDTSFGTGGKLLMPIGTGNDTGFSVIQQNDGKLVVAGSSRNGSDDDFSLIRLNADGSLDTSFGTGGKLLMAVGGRADSGYSVIQQSDGKLVVAGSSAFGLYDDFGLIRLNTDGSLDTGFDTDGKFRTDIGSDDDNGSSVIQQSDGKLVVAGYSNNGGNRDFSLIRLNADGSLDSGFDADGKLMVPVGAVNDYGLSVIVQSDGKLVVAGYSDNGGSNDFSVIRLNANGSLDTSFGTGGKLLIPVGSSADFARSMIQQSDGKLVLAGYSTSGGADFSLVRLDANGGLDTSFGTAGKLLIPVGPGSSSDTAFSVTQQSDGKLVVAGSSSGDHTDFSLIRLNPDGTLDSSFTGFAGSTLGGTAAFTQGGSAVTLDADVQAIDPQLVLLNSGSGKLFGCNPQPGPQRRGQRTRRVQPQHGRVRCSPSAAATCKAVV
jgi:uncharacterized delta-60 repeat protein